ncbi:conjugative transposon protein TraM [Flavobacterium sp. NRK1]|uniref:conjugative transposon protein TraM n=1 Tax=Flavobacterium sp. NRK1 TaxID=2954929 RepID=UPI00209253B4|nr:conjugative transposon protein TraM [Flavobacterium sp. NRK1]MCO6148985.1 conjugative transposon protein TraM [Flavobacterium sp. NRK1]
MKNNEPAPMRRKRKILWLLPLLLLPFTTLFFWAMGGGTPTTAEGQPKRGFNLKLPAANLEDEASFDKMQYYDKAAQDSSKINDLRKKDPNYSYDTLNETTDSVTGNGRQRSGLTISSFQSPQEKKVYEQLEALQRAVSRPPKGKIVPPAEPAVEQPAHINSQSRALEEMLQSMETASEPDPELAQIGGMLESILDIQYPERVQQKLREQSKSNRGRVYGITTQQDEEVVSSIASQQSHKITFTPTTVHTGFYGLDEVTTETFQNNAVSAVIAETQTVVNGATVKMELDQEIYINGQVIPKGTFVVGTASLKGERLTIEIQSIRHGNSLFPVELAVYDLDGLSGIYIPGAINRDVAKTSADRSMQTLGVTTLKDSWSAQAAGAGIEAAKGLFSKKVKLVKVTLKKGYRILLKDEQQDK